MPAISPARAANVVTYAWTKLDVEIMSLISGIWVLFMPCMTGSTASPEVTSITVHICTSCEWPCRWWLVEAQTRSKLPHVLQLHSGLPMLHSGSSAHNMLRGWDRSSWNIGMRSFKIYGIWPQASKQTSIHPHFHNTVPLVCGSLRPALTRAC